MSLWLESLYQGLNSIAESANADGPPDPGVLQRQAVCILRYLSMQVPRSWWQYAIETGDISESYVSLMRDLYQMLLQVPDLAGRVDYPLLAALAFADEDRKEKNPWRGTVHSECGIEEFLERPRAALHKRREVERLGRRIEKKAKALHRRGDQKGL